MKNKKRICFDLKEFKLWIEKIGCDDCQYFPSLEDDTIVHNWESNIQGKITKYRDIEIKGEIKGSE